MASLASPSRHKQQAKPLSRSALRARNALVPGHLPLADALASAAARRLFPLVEREDLIQVAREALFAALPAAEPASPLGPICAAASTGPCSTISAIASAWCASPAVEHEKGTWPLGHTSLDAPAAGESSLLEQLVEQLPAAQATALRLTVLEGLSLRAAAAQLQISPMAVSHREVRLATLLAQKKALAALRQQLVGAG
jgi:DNA-directed RNA polymerase specialized sigma subunit